MIYFSAHAKRSPTPDGVPGGGPGKKEMKYTEYIKNITVIRGKVNCKPARPDKKHSPSMLQKA
jgi:hypothetical protein